MSCNFMSCNSCPAIFMPYKLVRHFHVRHFQRPQCDNDLLLTIAQQWLLMKYNTWGAENNGHENDGPSKLQGMKLQDMKMQDMTRIDSILFNFSFFLVSWCWRCSNGTVWRDNMNWKKDPMIHVTSLREELSKQVTTPKILICNINNETIKICSSCKQFSVENCTVYTD